MVIYRNKNNSGLTLCLSCLSDKGHGKYSPPVLLYVIFIKESKLSQDFLCWFFVSKYQVVLLPGTTWQIGRVAPHQLLPFSFPNWRGRSVCASKYFSFACPYLSKARQLPLKKVCVWSNIVRCSISSHSKNREYSWVILTLHRWQKPKGTWEESKFIPFGLWKCT